MIIGFCGQAGAGKDTIADYLIKKYNFEKIPLAKPLKEACSILFDLNEEQLYGSLKETEDENWKTTPRIILQYFGTDIFRNDIKKIIPGLGDNFWINLFKKKYLNKKKDNKDLRVVVSDIRFKNEIDVVQELGGLVIKIIRTNMDNSDAHESERNIKNLKCDYEIINDGTKEDLYKKIEVILKNIFF